MFVKIFKGINGGNLDSIREPMKKRRVQTMHWMKVLPFITWWYFSYHNFILFQTVAFNEKYHETCTVGETEGWCMYQWQCFYSGGTPLGLCRQGFQFGACCKHDSKGNEVVTPSTKIQLSTTTTPKNPDNVATIQTPENEEEKGKSSDVIDSLSKHGNFFLFSSIILQKILLY